MDTTHISSGTIGVYFSQGEPNGTSGNGAVPGAEMVSHFENMMGGSQGSPDELAALLHQIAHPGTPSYGDLLRLQSELAARGIHWNLAEVEQAVLEDRKRRVGKAEETDHNPPHEEFTGFFQSLAQDMQGMVSNPGDINYAKLLQIQARLTEKGIYWNFVSKVADKVVNCAQTLMSNQV